MSEERRENHLEKIINEEETRGEINIQRETYPKLAPREETTIKCTFLVHSMSVLNYTHH